jgi:hypothetical protein
MFRLVAGTAEIRRSSSLDTLEAFAGFLNAEVQQYLNGQWVPV